MLNKTKNARRTDLRQATAAATSAKAGDALMRFAAGDGIEAVRLQYPDRMLGCVAFGTAAGAPHGGVPMLEVPMPVVDGNGHCAELWCSPTAVRTLSHEDVMIACNDDVLFAALTFDAARSPRYEDGVRTAYLKALRAIDSLGYPHLLRMWNYLPDIHRDDAGLERYRRFSLGRHEAFVAAGRDIARDAPAASAVGHGGDTAAVCLLAGRRRGIAIENPRQISAYRYPPQYGPRGPSFARALASASGGTAQLYVSGTASIVGHASQHAGDVERQAAETIANIQAVIAQAGRHAGFAPGAATTQSFKVYLRHADARAPVESRLREAFGAGAAILFLQAEICRRELLLEIEAVLSAAQA